MFERTIRRVVMTGRTHKWLRPFGLLALLVLFGGSALIAGAGRLSAWAREAARRMAAEPVRTPHRPATRLAAGALAACMLLTLLPASALAAETAYPCGHVHDESCGYVEPVEGVSCGHLNEDGSYSCAPEGAEADYVCEHTDDCGYVEAVEGVPCTHSCDICNPTEPAPEPEPEPAPEPEPEPEPVHAPLALPPTQPLAADPATTLSELTTAIGSASGTAEAPTEITISGSISVDSRILVDGKHIKLTGGTLTRAVSLNNDPMIILSDSASLTLEKITLDGNKIPIIGTTGFLVLVNGNSTLTMNTDAVLQNNLDIAVNLSNGTFNMTGGSITGNQGSGQNGSGPVGGVLVNSGDAFHMTGGSITGNSGLYGGVFVNSGGTFTVGGDAVVTGNTQTSGAASNVSLYTGTTIVLETAGDAPKQGMSIGVSGEAGTVIVQSGASAGDAQYFTADDLSLEVVHDNGTLKLAAKAAALAPTEDGKLFILYANGLPIKIVAGGTEGYTNILYDIDGDGRIADDEYLKIGADGPSAAGYDLHDWHILGGTKDTPLTADTSITMTGGKVSGIRGGGGVTGAALTGDTAIAISGGTVTNVFGGSDGSALTGDTTVAISGGAVIGSVYGGSNGGVLTGGTRITMTGGTVGGIHGGGNYGAVSGNTTLVIDGGTVGNVGGGGRAGAVGGGTSVEIGAGGAVTGSVYGGGFEGGAAVGAGTNVKILGTVGGNVYGDSNYSGMVTGTKTVTVGGGAKIGSFYNGMIMDGGDETRGVATFAISPALTGDSGCIVVSLPRDYIPGTIATGAVADDAAKIKLVGDGAEGMEAYFDSADSTIKVGPPAQAEYSTDGGATWTRANLIEALFKMDGGSAPTHQVRLLKDIDTGFAIGFSLLLDLNGRAWTNTGDAQAAVGLVQNASITLTDSVGGGSITGRAADDSNSAQPAVQVTGGTLTITGDKPLTLTGGAGSSDHLSGKGGIVVGDNGALNVTNNSLTVLGGAKGADLGVDGDALILSGAADLSGGTYRGCNGLRVNAPAGGWQSLGDIRLTGGTFIPTGGMGHAVYGNNGNFKVGDWLGTGCTYYEGENRITDADALNDNMLGKNATITVKQNWFGAGGKLFVGDTELTADNWDSHGIPGVSFDPYTATLTLDGANITTASTQNVGNCGIYAFCAAGGDFTIRLAGENKINAGANVGLCIAGKSDAPVNAVLTGGGTLDSGGAHYGVRCVDGNLTIRDTTVTAGAECITHGISSDGSAAANTGNLTIRGSTVTAGGDSALMGVIATSGVTIANSTVTATGTYIGIRAAYGSITLSGADTVVRAVATGSGSADCAIRSGTAGGSSQPITLADGLAITDPADGAVAEIDTEDVGYGLTVRKASGAGDIAKDVTISRKTGGGSSGGGSGTTTTTEKHPDGSVTTTVKDKATGAVTETTKYPDGTETVLKTEKNGGQTYTKQRPDGTKITADLPKGGETTAKVTLPRDTETVVSFPTASGTVVLRTLPDGSEEPVAYSLVEDGKVYVRLDGDAALRVTTRTGLFDDMNGHWAEGSANFTGARALFEGTAERTFTPEQPMSRAMLATVLYRLDGTPDVGEVMFSDTENGKWYSGGVAWAAENGIAGGVGGGLFGTDRAITRQDLAVMLWNYAKYDGQDVSIGEDTNILSCTDVGETAEWAVPALQWACGAGLLQGSKDGALNPTGSATRAEVSAMLERFIAVAVK